MFYLILLAVSGRELEELGELAFSQPIMLYSKSPFDRADLDRQYHDYCREAVNKFYNAYDYMDWLIQAKSFRRLDNSVQLHWEEAR